MLPAGPGRAPGTGRKRLWRGGQPRAPLVSGLAANRPVTRLLILRRKPAAGAACRGMRRASGRFEDPNVPSGNMMSGKTSGTGASGGATRRDVPSGNVMSGKTSGTGASDGATRRDVPSGNAPSGRSLPGLSGRAAPGNALSGKALSGKALSGKALSGKALPFREGTARPGTLARRATRGRAIPGWPARQCLAGDRVSEPVPAPVTARDPAVPAGGRRPACAVLGTRLVRLRYPLGVGPERPGPERPAAENLGSRPFGSGRPARRGVLGQPPARPDRQRATGADRRGLPPPRTSRGGDRQEERPGHHGADGEPVEGAARSRRICRPMCSSIAPRV